MGEQAEQAYMVSSGHVCVFITEGSRKIELAKLKKDDIFGETAIFTSGTYGANVEAIDNCQLIIITPQILNQKLEESDPVIKSLLLMLSKRLKHTNKALIKSETREFMDIDLI